MYVLGLKAKNFLRRQVVNLRMRSKFSLSDVSTATEIDISTSTGEELEGRDSSVHDSTIDIVKRQYW